MQLDDGGSGVCIGAIASTLPEVLCESFPKNRLSRSFRTLDVSISKPQVRLLISCGVCDITYGVPIGIGSALKYLAADVRAASHVAVRIIVDSEASLSAVEAHAANAAAAGSPYPVWGAFLKIDVGYHRAGVDITTAAGAEAGVALARRLAQSPAVSFLGLYSHSGDAYGAATPEEARAICRAECRMAREFQQRLAAEGVAAAVVSVGSTPSCACADDADGGPIFDGATEVHAPTPSRTANRLLAVFTGPARPGMFKGRIHTSSHRRARAAGRCIPATTSSSTGSRPPSAPAGRGTWRSRC